MRRNGAIPNIGPGDRRFLPASLLALGMLCGGAVQLRAQDTHADPTPASSVGRPTLAVGKLTGEVRLDGILDEPDWDAAERIESLTMIEPVEGGPVVASTTVWVLAEPQNILIGVLARGGSHQDRPRSVLGWSVRLRIRREPRRGSVRRISGTPGRGRRCALGRRMGGGDGTRRLRLVGRDSHPAQEPHVR